MAAYDLGPLGAKEGPGVIVSWAPPRLMPFFLPWMALLLLFLPRQNRSSQVCWLLLPLAFFLLITAGLAAILLILHAGQTDVLAQSIIGLACGQAAIWLLSPYLKGRHRITVFLGILLIAVTFAAGSMALLPNWTARSIYSAALISLIMTFALSLAGFLCRRGFNGLRFSAWTLLWIFVGWVVRVIVESVTGNVPEPFIAVLFVVVFPFVTFALVLPFLIVSFANPFFRARFTDLFAMQTPAPSAPAPTIPPVIPPTPLDKQSQP